MTVSQNMGDHAGHAKEFLSTVPYSIWRKRKVTKKQQKRIAQWNARAYTIIHPNWGLEVTFSKVKKNGSTTGGISILDYYTWLAPMRSRIVTVILHLRKNVIGLAPYYSRGCWRTPCTYANRRRNNDCNTTM